MSAYAVPLDAIDPSWILTYLFQNYTAKAMGDKENGFFIRSTVLSVYILAAREFLRLL